MKEKLLNRNIWLLIVGQNTSAIGNEVYYMALVFWLQYTLSSTLMLGTIMSISTLVMVATGYYSGILVDRYNRKTIIIISDILSGTIILIISVLAMYNVLRFWHLVILTPILSFLAGLLSPAVRSIFPDLIKNDTLMKANSINETGNRISRIIGPSVAGGLYGIYSIPVLFFLNAISFFVSGIMELFIEVPHVEKSKKQQKSIIEEVKTSFKYISANIALKHVLIYTVLANIFGAPLMIILPKYFEKYLSASQAVMANSFSIRGLGAVIALMSISILMKSAKNYWKIFILTTFGTWVSILLLGVFINVNFSILVLFLMGAFGVTTTTILMTVVQINVPSHERGKFFGMFGALSMAVTPLSMFIFGIVGEFADIPLIFIIASSLNIISLYYLFIIKKDFKSLFLRVIEDQKAAC
jgi:MFS family permease